MALNFEQFKDDENKDLNTFFGEAGAAPPAPPKQTFDTNQFHHQTAGGFGSAPVVQNQPNMVDLSGNNGQGTNMPNGHMGGNMPMGNMAGGGQQQPNLFGDAMSGKMNGADLAGMAGSMMQNGGATGAFLAAGATSLFAAAPQIGQDAINTLKFQLGNMKPWPQFLWPYNKPDDSAAALTQMTSNFAYFQTNYALCFVAYLIFQIVYSPISLFTIAFFTLTWLWFLKKNEDPEWVVAVGGIPLGPTQRYVVLILVTALMVFMLCGSLILSSCLFFAFFAGIHAAVKVPVIEAGYAPPGAIGTQGNMV